MFLESQKSKIKTLITSEPPHSSKNVEPADTAQSDPEVLGMALRLIQPTGVDITGKLTPPRNDPCDEITLKTSFVFSMKSSIAIALVVFMDRPWMTRQLLRRNC